MASNMDATSQSNQQQSNASDLPQEVDQLFAKIDSKLKKSLSQDFQNGL